MLTWPSLLGYGLFSGHSLIELDDDFISLHSLNPAWDLRGGFRTDCLNPRRTVIHLQSTSLR